ncbi:ribonuclease [Xylophilus sp. Kf1]|nr:ribonuclease [Xylophilus sp. Kf1]
MDLKTIESANEIVDSLRINGHLPAGFITKAEAYAAGWQEGKALSNYIKNGQIGGDVYRNIENIVPMAAGRTWYEADVGLENSVARSKQPGTRALYSSDGLLYISSDHYATVIEIGKWK